MNKEDLKREINNTIDGLATKINEMEAKKDRVKEETKDKYDGTLQMMKEKRKELKSKYEEVEGASEEKWNEIKTSLDSAKGYFEKGVKEMTSAF